MDDSKRRFLTLLGEGKTLEQASEEIGITRQTYYNWRRADSDFAAQCDLIRSSNREARRVQRATARQEEKAEAKRRKESAVPEQPADDDGLTLYNGERAQTLAEEHAETLRTSLRASGRYTEALEPQIAAAARVWGAAQVVWYDIDRYAAIQPQTSREGDVRLSVNPVFATFKAQMESYTAMLRTLGLNFDGKLEIKERSSRESFFAALDADDDIQ